MANWTSGLCTIVAVLLPGAAASAQSCPEQMRGGWESELPARELFEVEFVISRHDDGSFSSRLRRPGTEESPVVWRDGRHLSLQSNDGSLTLDARVAADESELEGFIAHASNLYRVSLPAVGKRTWQAVWSPLPGRPDTLAFDLYFDDDGTGGSAGYFFFRDQRMPGLYGYGTSCSGNSVKIGEMNLGLMFEGDVDDTFSILSMRVTGPGGTTGMSFTRMPPEGIELGPSTADRRRKTPGKLPFSDRAPEGTDDGWRTARPSGAGIDVDILEDMFEAISGNEFPLTHAVLIARSGELAVEEYFHGYDRSTLHDMRSASKSITSTLVGLAIDRGLIDSPGATVLPFFPEYRSFASRDPAKADIRIRDLLTMSSGLDANDSDRGSIAAENAYQSQSSQPDWVKFALDAPMVAVPGSRTVYGSANPLILGGILDNVVPTRVEWFAEDTLFAPLGIDSYRIFMDPTGVAYMGGGMHLRPRDMLKIGQLYLDGGNWRGQRILAESWVAESFGKYGRLEPLDRNGNEYGYLWWHESYRAQGRTVDSVEARGNGGQYIFIVPQLDLVAVITSGNYRGGLTMTRQPQRLFRQYILPSVSFRP